MAGLNLNPNPIVIATQAGVFLASLHFIRTLMVKPYLEVKAKRDHLTLGSQSEAEGIVESNKEGIRTLEKKLSDALSEARLEASEMRKKAFAECDAIIESAEEKARNYVAAAKEELDKEVAIELEKVPALVNQLSETIYKKTLG